MYFLSKVEKIGYIFKPNQVMKIEYTIIINLQNSKIC